MPGKLFTSLRGTTSVETARSPMDTADACWGSALGWQGRGSWRALGSALYQIHLIFTFVVKVERPTPQQTDTF